MAVVRTDSKTPSQTTAVENEPYSVFTVRQKWTIVAIISIAGMFSPFTANIYLPAMPTVAVDLKESIEKINLTVTVYMLMQGLSPMLWGTLADRIGRRPIQVACFIVLCGASVGLALIQNYGSLVALRCIQAIGSASPIALGAGVVGDISIESERGGYMGWFMLGPMIGPTIGPVIGGAISGSLGWRWIFWFLTIASAAYALVLACILPETLRSIVGNGSVTPSMIYRPWIPLLAPYRAHPSSTKPPPKPLRNPLRIFLYLDIVLELFLGGITYAIFYGITTSISTLFKDIYPFLSERDLGLIFLSCGGGMIIGSISIGKILDYSYKHIKLQLIEEGRKDPEKSLEDLEEEVVREENFPIERARLNMAPVYVLVFCATTIAYGWCLEAKVNIAAPLIFLIIIGYTTQGVMNTTSTIIVDLLPGQGSSVTACNNLVRCSLGAILVAVMDIILKSLGPGWSYTLLACICMLTIPGYIFAIKFGPRCRALRREPKTTT